MSGFFSQVNLLTIFIGVGMLLTAIALLFMLATTLSGEEKRMRRRVAQVAGGRSLHQAMATGGPSLRRDTADSSIQSLDRLIKRLLPRPAKLRARLAATGRRISLGEYLLANVLVLVVAFSAFAVFGFPLLPGALFSLGIGLALPHFAVGFMIKRRRSKFVMLLPEGIDLIVRGLRSGLPITESMKVVGQEIPNPVGGEFRGIIESYSVGMTLDQALWAVAERIGVPEFRFFAITLSVQQETGGNLTETLENLSNILRRRKQMKLKIRALTGEARASATILGLLPFVMFGALMLIHPDYGMVLINTARGHALLAAGIISMSIGIGTMFKMTKFEI
jgi:tight adherence protein B